MPDVRSQRIYSWALETALHCVVDGAAIAQAGADYRRLGGAQAWLLDVSEGSPDPKDPLGVLPVIVAEVVALRARGLQRVALVAPPIVLVMLADVERQVAPVRVYPFGTRAEAIAWFAGGCR